MKIFWEDALGNSCPDDAIFSIFKFGGKRLTRISKWERISNLPPFEKKIPIKNIRYSPSLEIWRKNVETALQQIKEDKIEKVVLARCCEVTLSEETDPLTVLTKLKSLNQNGQVFGFIDKNFAFMGCTPELLYSRHNREILSQALAGTVPRGLDEASDFVLENILKQDPKLLKEVDLVKNFLLHRLQSMDFDTQTSSLSVSKTPFVQHLSYSIHATSSKDVVDAKMLKTLHPTPALCGLPQGNAQAFIKNHEPFPRNFYASAIGWSTQNASDFKVAIRCCFFQKNKVRFYTGAGIVQGSDPDLEWKELDDKMRLFKEIFEIP